MRLMFRHHRRCQRHLGHLMPGWFGIIVLPGSGQRPLASLADGWPVMHHLFDAIGRKASAGMTRMSRLSARHTPGRRFAGTLGRLRCIARRRTRGVRRVLPELSFEVPNTLLQRARMGLKPGDLPLQHGHDGLELPDSLIPLLTP